MTAAMTQPLRRIGAGLAGLAFVGLAAFLLWDYPVGRIPILLCLLLYSGLLWRNRDLWLFILPALLPISDLALYSGRLFISEFDFFLMTTLAVLCFMPPRALSQKPKIGKAEITIGLMALSYLISTILTLTYPVGPEAFALHNYQNPLNSIRVAKGFFWALLLWPALKNAYETTPEKTGRYLVSGIIAGLFLAGIGILWERGVINDLVHWQNMYKLFYDLLNFSTTYRITGLFAGMHVGGTAIDGYLIMAISFCLYGFFTRKSTAYQIISLICLVLGVYGIMVTFSRGLYGGFLVISLFLAFALYRQHQTAGRTLEINGSLLVVLVGMTAGLGFLFLRGGYGALAGALFLIFGPAYGVLLQKRLPLLLAIVLACGIFLFGNFVIFDSLTESKWAKNSLLFSGIASLVSGLVFTGLSYWFGQKRLRADFSFRKQMRITTLFVLTMSIFWLAIMPPLLSYRIGSRYTTVDADMAHRLGNWQNSLHFSEKGLLHSLFGTGVGSFPRYYFFNNYNQEPTVHYRFTSEKDQTVDKNFLALGNGDFNITQKIPDLRPHRFYRLRGQARQAEHNFLASFKICPKHILYSDRYIPNCITQTVRGAGDNQWHDFEVTINSGSIGTNGIFHWPPTLLINNSRTGTILEISRLQLIDDRGRNLILNGDFTRGGDHWMMIRDFSHDAWHAKNIFIHMIFEQGYFGLLAFLLLLGYALFRQARAMKNHDPLAPLLIAALVGVLVVGLFGTIIDNPRVATLYFLLTFFALLRKPRIPHG